MKDNIAFGLPLLPVTIEGAFPFCIRLVLSLRFHLYVSDLTSSRALWLDQRTEGQLFSGFCTNLGEQFGILLSGPLFLNTL